MLTFAGESPGPLVREVAPAPEALTLREHHSFVQLPDNDYQPLASTRGAGISASASSIMRRRWTQPIRKQFISRHRLKKKDPSAAMSDPVKPITYYLDRGAPEPIRSALLDGARWWNQAFEAAGFRNAYPGRTDARRRRSDGRPV